MYEITEIQNVTRTKNGGVPNPSQSPLKNLLFFQNSDKMKTFFTVLCCFYLSTNVTISADISYLKALYDCKAIVFINGQMNAVYKLSTAQRVLFTSNVNSQVVL